MRVKKKCQCVVEENVSQLRRNREDMTAQSWTEYKPHFVAVWPGRSRPEDTVCRQQPICHIHTDDKHCNVETTCISLVPKHKTAEVHVILSFCLHEDWFMEAELVPSYYQYTALSEKWVVRLLSIRERSLNIIHVQQTLNKCANKQSITAAPRV